MFVGNGWGVPRHTKVPLSSTNLKGRLHQKVRGVARGVFRCRSRRQKLFGLRVDRRGSSLLRVWWFPMIFLIQRLRREERKRRQELGLQAPYIIKLSLRDDSYKGNTPVTTSLCNNPCTKLIPKQPNNLCNRNTENLQLVKSKHP